MRGFTLIELLVSVLIFSFVILGLYLLFDQGQWLYLQSERRGNMQENARLIMEQMERDFRMIGAGVPLSTNLVTGTSWLPAIFDAADARISFTADIDNGTEFLSRDVGTIDNSHIFIATDTVPSVYYSQTMDANDDGVLDIQLPVILVDDQRRWEGLLAITLDSNDKAIVTTSDVQNPGQFKSAAGTVQTLERVFYRMVDQNGVIVAGPTCTDSYPFCTVQRQEFQTNDPTLTTPDPTKWLTIGSYVTFLDLDYSTLGGAPVALPGGLGSIDRITITLKCSDRSSSVGTFQSATLRSEVLIRNRRL